MTGWPRRALSVELFINCVNVTSRGGAAVRGRAPVPCPCDPWPCACARRDPYRYRVILRSGAAPLQSGPERNGPECRNEKGRAEDGEGFPQCSKKVVFQAA